MNYESMKVYGKPLTAHHKKLIEDDFKDRLLTFVFWLHSSGIEIVPHEDWKPRYYKFPDGSLHSASIVVAKFLSECPEKSL
jgi:hypothetical protein